MGAGGVGGVGEGGGECMAVRRLSSCGRHSARRRCFRNAIAFIGIANMRMGKLTHLPWSSIMTAMPPTLELRCKRFEVEFHGKRRRAVALQLPADGQWRASQHAGYGEYAAVALAHACNSHAVFGLELFVSDGWLHVNTLL